MRADRERAEPGTESNPGPAPGRDRDTMGEGTVAFGGGWAPALRCARASRAAAAHLANARANLATWGGVEPEPEAEEEKGEEKGEGDDEPEPEPRPEERRE